MPSMVVLVDLKEGVSPEDYERWVLESYAPVVRRLPSVEDWRNYRTTGLLGRDMAGEEMQETLAELHDLAEVTQITAERFA
jgi:hypothetical protein